MKCNRWSAIVCIRLNVFGRLVPHLLLSSNGEKKARKRSCLFTTVLKTKFEVNAIFRLLTDNWIIIYSLPRHKTTFEVAFSKKGLSKADYDIIDLKGPASSFRIGLSKLFVLYIPASRTITRHCYLTLPSRPRGMSVQKYWTSQRGVFDK